MFYLLMDQLQSLKTKVVVVKEEGMENIHATCYQL